MNVWPVDIQRRIIFTSNVERKKNQSNSERANAAQTNSEEADDLESKQTKKSSQKYLQLIYLFNPIEFHGHLLLSMGENYAEMPITMYIP